jgi:hypothetical protein
VQFEFTERRHLGGSWHKEGSRTGRVRLSFCFRQQFFILLPPKKATRTVRINRMQSKAMY